MRGPSQLPTACVAVLLAIAFSGWAAMHRRCNAQQGDARAQQADTPHEAWGSVVIELIHELDADGNGVLQPDEVSDRARPHVERCAALAGLDASEPLSIEALEEAVYSHYRDRENPAPRRPRRGTRSPLEDGAPAPGFGHVEGVAPVPGFGEDSQSGLHVRVEPRDLERAGYRLRRDDRNHDGFIDSREAREAQWSDDPFRYDKNKDGRLSREELGVRYATFRLREASRDGRSSSERESDRRREEYERHRREEEEKRREEDTQRHEAEEERRKAEEERRRHYYANRDSYHLAETLMRRYDRNRNGGLDHNERENAGIPASADADRRGRVDRGELARWLVDRAGKSQKGLPQGLPEWFRERDANRDGQVAMAEFTDDWTDEKEAEFDRFDLNDDGFVTPGECLKAMIVPIGRYASQKFQVIPPHGTVYSEIEVRGEGHIADLNVQISITHTHDESLDVFLIGPVKTDRIELFTGVGGSDDHFQNTILDDESATPIIKARPPFSGTYQPESVLKKQPSLRHFYGKPIAGTWTLMVRAQRSDRSGVLHGWSLIVKPGEPGEPGEPEGLDPKPQTDSPADGRGGRQSPDAPNRSR